MKFNLSLTHKITGFTVGIVVICGGINGFQFENMVDSVVMNAKTAMLTDLLSASDSLFVQMHDQMVQTQTFAQSPELKGNDYSEVSRLFDQEVMTVGTDDFIALLNAEGKPLAMSSVNATGKKLNVDELKEELSFHDQSWFSNLVKGKVQGGTVDPSYQPWLETLYGEARYVTPFYQVVPGTQGAGLRVLVRFANFKWAESELNSFSESIVKRKNIYRHLQLYLVDSNGTVMSFLDGNMAKEGASAVAMHEDVKAVPKSLVTEGWKTAKEFEQIKAGVDLVKSPVTHQEAYVTSVPLKNLSGADEKGWSMMMIVSKDDALGRFKVAFYWFYGVLFASIFIAGMCAYFYFRKMGNGLAHEIDRLSGAVEATRKAGTELNDSAVKLSESSNESAAAIQESVSALSEMSSMIAQTTASTNRSLEATTDIAERSIAGREIMVKLGKSMEAIDQANTALQEIESIITGISQKTAVINDIVFKTQLLSFNASIEAARAGQYGKGFAVVAEEVGNLAQMSGDAAREIETLITDSEKKVESTLDLIQRRVREGNIVSNEALTAFKGIAGAIDHIKTQVKSIVEASVQQDVGVQQTQKAMSQLDVFARQNCELAEQVTRSSQGLGATSADLAQVSVKLVGEVMGSQKRKSGAAAFIATETESLRSVPDLDSFPDISAEDDSFKKVS